MIYAISDIHGQLDALKKSMSKVDLSGGSRLVLLGDYIDYGSESGQTLRFIRELQKRYGEDQVIVLRGNHEEMFLEWLDTYGGPYAGKPDEYGLIPWSDWLKTDPNYGTFHSFITEGQWELFQQLSRSASADTLNIEAVQMVLFANRELIQWLRALPYFYETERQIFVHAGIDEEAEDWWPYATPEHMFVGKYPPTTGEFLKDIVAGHVSTCRAAGDRTFHGIYHDGMSHYYIDGGVTPGGSFNILAYDEEKQKYLYL